VVLILSALGVFLDKAFGGPSEEGPVQVGLERPGIPLQKIETNGATNLASSDAVGNPRGESGDNAGGLTHPAETSRGKGKSETGSWWQETDPLLLAVIAAILTIFGNMLVGYFNNAATIKQEEVKAKNALDLEKLKAKYTLILEAIATNDPKAAERNIDFFLGAELLEDSSGKIRQALKRFSPVLPSPGGAATNIPRGVEVSELAKLYNFPPDLDGTGQKVGLLEFAGGFRQRDLEKHFASLGMGPPHVTAVGIEGGANLEEAPPNESGEVLSNLQIVGTIAPKAEIFAYFAPYTPKGWASAIRQAIADRVSVLLICWGESESEWDRGAMDAINGELELAAKRGLTIVCAAGDSGVTSGMHDGKRHVLFPASSPWVLAVGGTSLISRASEIVSETVWKTKTGATGGGFSEVFKRPDWQVSVPIPKEAEGTHGRGIPDVSATAWNTMAMISLPGAQAPIGGTGVAAAIWAGLILLLNQGLGRNVGHFNPLIYSALGPEGVLRAVSKGDNSINRVKGYHAAAGWSPVAGWGSPDGNKLLNWLKVHQ